MRKYCIARAMPWKMKYCTRCKYIVFIFHLRAVFVMCSSLHHSYLFTPIPMNFCERIPFGMKSNESRKKRRWYHLQRNRYIWMDFLLFKWWCLYPFGTFEDTMIRFQVCTRTQSFAMQMDMIWCRNENDKISCQIPSHRDTSSMKMEKNAEKLYLYFSNNTVYISTITTHCINALW